MDQGPWALEPGEHINAVEQVSRKFFHLFFGVFFLQNSFGWSFWCLWSSLFWLSCTVRRRNPSPQPSWLKGTVVVHNATLGCADRSRRCREAAAVQPMYPCCLWCCLESLAGCLCHPTTSCQPLCHQWQSPAHQAPWGEVCMRSQPLWAQHPLQFSRQWLWQDAWRPVCAW